MQLQQMELEGVLRAAGASLVGYADLAGVAGAGWRSGVAVAVNLPRDIVQAIGNGPTRAYYEAYHMLNAQLDGIVRWGEDYLRGCGWKAHAQTIAAVREQDSFRTELPHKTVAVRAGLGWIGKSALFVSEAFGTAVRLSSLLTDAPLVTGTPVTESRCGDCRACTESCPGHAVSGKTWHAGMDRDEFFDAQSCRSTARQLAAVKLNEQITLCGKCIEVCPHTRRYLQNS